VRKWIYFAIVLVLGGLFWWGMQRDPGELKSVLVGKPAPDFELPLLPPYRAEWGERFRLSEHRGKPVVLNFWASWCYPACYEEAPVLELGWRKYKDRVLFFGINTQDKEAAALDFVRRFNLTFPQGYDPRGKVGIDYGMYGVPETFFIDAEGIVRYRHAGSIDARELEKRVEEVLR